MRLTPAQLSAVDQHLRETNLLTNEELIIELTDHYATVLLDRMAQGMTFATALADTQQAFGGRRGLQAMERQYKKSPFGITTNVGGRLSSATFRIRYCGGRRCQHLLL